MSHGETLGSSNSRFALVAICAVLVLYLVALAAGYPQKATEMIVGASSHAQGAEEHAQAPAAAAPADDGAEAAPHDDEQASAAPPYWTVLPFLLLLGAIALLPLIPATAHWWESNLHRFYVAAGLGLVTIAYYIFLHGMPIDGHWPAHYIVEPSSAGPTWEMGWAVFSNAILSEYIPFIVLLFSLYTIAGGIRIQGDLPAQSLTNLGFIATGALLASFIGTTGAAMLLIRPLLETNAERQHVRHTVVFFIFAVCNCGGLLLPIGDPPLFLGYLRGVDFLWTLTLIGPWLFVNGMLLIMYFVMDRFYFYPRESPENIASDHDEFNIRRLSFHGLGLNGLLLVGVILSVALLDPSKAIPGTTWHPWLYLREVVQLGLVVLSLVLGSNAIRAENRFNYSAILEVAALFVGIFICMQPALQILGEVGPRLGIDSATKFFWITGALSSVLDNAPTYVVFFETARTLEVAGVPTMAGVAEPMLAAISLGAVFMGAMTYIGNGPNFMVKAIAEAAGVRMPSFFGYIGYSVCLLLPLLVLTNLIFFW